MGEKVRQFLLSSKDFYCDIAGSRLRAVLQRISKAFRLAREVDWPLPDWLRQRDDDVSAGEICAPAHESIAELLGLYDVILADLHGHYANGAALLFGIQCRISAEDAECRTALHVAEEVLREHLEAMMRDLAVKQLVYEFWRYVEKGSASVTPEVERTHAHAAITSAFVSQLLPQQLRTVSECVELTSSTT